MDINIDNVSKIEGHAGLEVTVRGGKVTDVQLKISESKRFYTQGIRGKPYHSLPQMVEHICGTCSIAHLTAATEAVENAIGAQPSEQTLRLRKLSLWGLNLRDHAMHLYLFCLPDLAGVDSVLELPESRHQLLHDAFDVKAAGNLLCTHIIGATIHPNRAQVGRFSQIPDAAKTKEVIASLMAARPKVLALIDLFASADWKFERNTRFVSVTSPDFSYLGEQLCDSKGECIPRKNYFDHLQRIVIPYSQATGFKFDGKNYTVGALARLNLGKPHLHPDTRRDAAAALTRFPSKNIFDQNVAQAVEMLNAIDNATDALESTEFNKEDTPLPPAKEGTGIGVIEAPRGTLYYMLKVGADGKLVEGTLVIPTAQNQINIQDDIRLLVEQNLDKDRHDLEHEIEKLIRAYDPCMSCATHFLKTKWDIR